MSSGNDTQTCRKCGNPAFIVLDKSHVQCKACFVDSCHRKFRQALGKSGVVGNNEAVMIAYSGGLSSRALLDMVKARLETSSSQEPKFRPAILHIEMRSIDSDSTCITELRKERWQNLNQLLANLKQDFPNWPIYWAPFEICESELGDWDKYSLYNPSEDISESYLFKCDCGHLRLKHAINSAGELTERLDYAAKRLGQLINSTTCDINSKIREGSNKFKTIMVGSSASQLANRLLVDVITGQGSSLKPTVSILDDRLSVPVIRPLRDFSKKELAFYLRANSIEVSTTPNLETMADRNSSIQTLTEFFLNKLYVDYPSTYNALLRTGEKLV